MFGGKKNIYPLFFVPTKIFSNQKLMIFNPSKYIISNIQSAEVPCVWDTYQLKNIFLLGHHQYGEVRGRLLDKGDNLPVRLPRHRFPVHWDDPVPWIEPGTLGRSTLAHGLHEDGVQGFKPRTRHPLVVKLYNTAGIEYKCPLTLSKVLQLQVKEYDLDLADKNVVKSFSFFYTDIAEMKTLLCIS